jgi:hypothetical protein
VHRARRRRFHLRLALALGLACSAALSAAGFARAATDLGPIGFGAVAVDDARAHVYVSGPTAGVVDVLDYFGNQLATIPNLPAPGAWS